MSIPRRRCYVASPLGFTEAGRDYYETVLLARLRTVVEPVDPWGLVDSAEIELARDHGPQAVRQLGLEVGRRNTRALRGCDLLVAYLEGPEPDSGTVAELGFAAGLGLPCFGLRSDLRDTGDLGSRLNLQVESFIRESNGALVRSLDELLAALNGFSRGRSDMK